MIIEHKKSNPPYVDEFWNDANQAETNEGAKERNEAFDIASRLTRIQEITNSNGYFQLRNDLIEHLWSKHGDL
jgi:hypothetical protein